MASEISRRLERGIVIASIIAGVSALLLAVSCPLVPATRRKVAALVVLALREQRGSLLVLSKSELRTAGRADQLEVFAIVVDSDVVGDILRLAQAALGLSLKRALKLGQLAEQRLDVLSVQLHCQPAIGCLVLSFHLHPQKEYTTSTI